MRIPLDYYQILGVTIQASAQQLEQAYSDRLLQQPRREYNEQAIQARRELIQHAYQVLSDSEQKAAYDAQFFVNMQSVETAGVTAISETAAPATELMPENSQPTAVLTNPTIEIASSQLLGALLIFHEFGEYELALKLGIDFYNSQEFTALQRQQDEVTRKATQENIILALALAYLELGREQWHQQEYENAALSDQLGLDLLKQENLFPQIQEELELDLYKLRPYRVLELISQNLVNSPERSRGFELLREMLLQRQGIEGKGEDLSGLSFDQFLCFIQQLRTYLTSAEQQQLFDSEAQSESAIANYLAVYALLGRGFSLKQPELILRAQRKLDLLSDKQDVAWEQAVSALLLGHTEKAIKKLQSSQDTSKLVQVQQHSPESIDLLPGICFYSEKWLQEDVLAQFIDLVGNPLTLKEYFAEREVQKYLEEL
ncbi:MAG: J domain-containing protein, partial [Waterburya sp.]